MGKHTGKSLFNVDHLACTGLHKPTTLAFGIFPADFAANYASVFQIAFVSCNDFDGRELPAKLSTAADFGAFFFQQAAVFLDSIFGLDVDHVEKPLEAFERVVVCDVVDE